jgi:hypothetical protein
LRADSARRQSLPQGKELALVESFRRGRLPMRITIYKYTPTGELLTPIADAIFDVP